MNPPGSNSYNPDELGTALDAVLAHDLVQLLNRGLGRHWCKPAAEPMPDAWFEGSFTLAHSRGGSAQSRALMWMPRKEAVAAAADLVKMPAGQADAIAKGADVNPMLLDSLNELANLTGGSLTRVLRSCCASEDLRVQSLSCRTEAAAEAATGSQLFLAQVELLGLKAPLRFCFRTPCIL
jgi:hypothetical protein